MAIADAAGFPVAAHVESASPHEVKLVEATIDSGFIQYAPDRLGYILRDLCCQRGVELLESKCFWQVLKETLFAMRCW